MDDQLFSRIDELETQLDSVYKERDLLVCALSKVFPSYLSKHKDKEGENWGPEWTNVVFIKLPTGQASWHIRDPELELFSHLKYKDNNWDGHTKNEKYKRLNSLKAGVNCIYPLIFRNEEH